MPYAIVRYDQTPNPLALRCALSKPVAPWGEQGAIRSYSAGAQTQDPVAHAVLRVPGVTHVLISDTWLSVVKKPDAPWPALQAALERALGEVP